MCIKYPQGGQISGVAHGELGRMHRGPRRAWRTLILAAVCSIAVTGAETGAVAGDAAPTPPMRGSTPTCLGQEATLVGTPGPDELKGTHGDDVIVARGGRDRVFSIKGTDLICGGGGDDLLCGGTEPTGGGSGPPEGCHLNARVARGPHQVSGGAGNDRLFIRRGALFGGDNRDSLTASAAEADSRLVGGEGDDLLESDADAGQVVGVGGLGDDDIRFQNSGDRIRGGAGRDRLRGGGGADEVRGGPGSDRLTGNRSDDRLFGQTGDDLLDGGEGRDRCSGGRGDDRRTACESGT